MHIPPDKGPEQRGVQEEYPQNDEYEQRLSAGGHLPKMSLFEGIVYYVFFGWAWGFGPRLEKKELIKQITEVEPTLKVSDLNGLTIDNLKKTRSILDIPSGQTFIKRGDAHDFSLILNHEKAIQIFENFEKAQTLLYGRIDNEIAIEINKYFLSQNNEVANNLTNFINYAVKLKQKKPNEFPNSNETLAIDLNRDKLITENPLIKDFLDELVFVTTGSDSELIHKLLIETTELISISSRNQPFSLLLQHKTSNKEILIFVEDRHAKTKRFFVIKNPNEVKKDEFNATADKIDHDRWLAAKEFRANAQQVLARGIYFLSYPSEIKEAQIAITSGEGKIMTSVTDAKVLEEVAITAEKNNGAMDVKFTYKGITHTQSYPLREGETQEELAERITNDKSLDRALEIAKGHFTRSKEPIEIAKKVEEPEPENPQLIMGFRFKNDKESDRTAKRVKKSEPEKVETRHVEAKPILKKAPSSRKEVMDQIKEGNIYEWEGEKLGLTQMPPEINDDAFLKLASVDQSTRTQVLTGIKKSSYTFPLKIAIPHRGGYAYSKSMTIIKKSNSEYIFQLNVAGKTLEHQVIYDRKKKIDLIILEAYSHWVMEGEGV